MSASKTFNLAGLAASVIVGVVCAVVGVYVVLRGMAFFPSDTPFRNSSALSQLV